MMVENKEKTTEIVQWFANKIFGPAFQQTGEIIGDWARYWRLKNLLSISKRFDKICEDKGINPSAGRHLALSIGLPMLEMASYQDDPFLQERWAHLIASSLTPDNETAVSFSLDMTYVEALHQFSRLDCEVLEYVVENGIESRNEGGSVTIDPIMFKEIKQAFPDSVDVHISLEKLLSLGSILCSLKTPLSSAETGEHHFGAFATVLSPTIMGINLYISASGKSPNWLDSKELTK